MVNGFPAGTSGRVVGRCLDGSGYTVELSRWHRAEVTPFQIEAATGQILPFAA
jgi:hypothetical protein